MTRANGWKPILVIALCGGLAAGCGGGGGDDDDDAVGDPNDGTAHQQVADSLTMPTNTSDAAQLGFDLDGDSSVDNALGNILGVLRSLSSFDIQAAIDTNIGDAVLILNEYTALDGDDPAVHFKIFTGADTDGDPTNNLSGSAALAIMTDQIDVTDAKIVAGRLTAEAASLTLSIPFSDTGDPIPLSLINVHLDAAVGAGGSLSGKLGGAIKRSDIDNTLIPALAGQLQSFVAAPACPATPDLTRQDCGCTGTAATLMTTLDAPITNTACLAGATVDADDCVIDLEEIKCNDLLNQILAPDVDLVDGENGPDGDPEESLSLGVGFSTVGASF